jgi:hypothetical protein
MLFISTTILSVILAVVPTIAIPLVAITTVISSLKAVSI